jgi:hypothetical protein
MLPDRSQLGGRGTGAATVLQRMKQLAGDDPDQLKAWNLALRWAKDRSSDHEVHVRDEAGRERTKRLFEEFEPAYAKDYDDPKLREMLDFFVLAREQYASFL